MNNKILKKKNIIILILVLCIYILFKTGNTFEPIEELTIPSGIGVDVVDSNLDGDMKYKVIVSEYNYYDEKQINVSVLEGTASTVPETRESRQLKSDGKFLLGLERVVVVGQEAAEFGLKNFVDALFSNRTINDVAYIVVCKGKSEDILKFQAPGSTSSSEYIDKMIQHSAIFGFFPRNYKLLDMYIRLDSEGRNFAIPYIEVKESQLQISGMALFKNDKMVRVIGKQDSKWMNLLRENNVRGILTVQKNIKEYASFYGTSKRRVKCTREGGRYIFDIDLSLKGEIISNSLYPNLAEEPEAIKIAEAQFAEEAEKKCIEFIKKMKSEYKIDCLSLGRNAAAKYGRRTGVDWNDVVSNSEIRVDVKVKVTEIGRGDY
ncbi:Ger(x)C family spore germination protein [Clostridium thermarum]|uniref:Ger(x)C family spore germination protein n=1 Tax=Clostridium thermarum TaxID=1716543 RepID=UPI0013D0B533|nr:Ger(x)C family spore germination protein [Clostridium thermarum]